jgi:Fe-S-cluster-containing dehydrogenase component
VSEETPISRRSFAQSFALSVSGLVGFLSGTALLRRGSGTASASSTGTSEEKGDSPARWGMAIDLDRCTACGACVVACHTENNVPTVGPGPELRGAAIDWMQLLPQAADAPATGVQPDMLPLPCMHCDNPPCVKVCPVNATYQTEEGLVAQVWDRCIGCRYCQVACPYGRRYFNWMEPDWPDTQLNALNPDVATRPSGVIEKCTFCDHRIRKVKEDARMEERPVEDEEVQQLTACAEACPAEAIIFGNLEDERSRVSRLSRSPRAFRLLEHLGTRPKVTYLTKDRRSEP